jgi:hypothetical protein
VPIRLTIDILRSEAVVFAKAESKFPEPSLYGVTDGKAVGTYLEHKFQAYLQAKYQYSREVLPRVSIFQNWMWI